MSVESITIAFHHSRARGTAKLVLLGIANHDGDGGAWPSVATLARYARADARSVQRAIDTLEKLGEIRRDRQAGGTIHTAPHMRPNLYHFRLACPSTCDGTRNHRSTGELSTGVTPVSPGDASVTRGVTPVSPEPSFNHLTQEIQESPVLNRVREHGCTHETVDGTDRCAIACRRNFDWYTNRELSA